MAAACAVKTSRLLPPPRAPLLLLSQLAAGVLLYGLLSLVFQRETLAELRNLIRTRGKKA